MLVSWKDGFKLVGVSVIFFCAVFVCTFLLSYYLDVTKIGDIVPEQLTRLYEAQVAMAKFTTAITGGVLALVAAVMLLFYVGLYVDAHAKQLGVLKALGYSDIRLAVGFWVFGLSALLGCALGFAAGYIAAPSIYSAMTIEGLPEITVNFHCELLFALVVLPAVVFSFVAFGFAYLKLKRPVMQLIKGKAEKIKTRGGEDKERAFLKDLSIKTLSSHKVLVFFFAFSAFCFSAMVQMGLSMGDLSVEMMGITILIIGLALAAVTAFMSVTALINGNIRTISLLKTYGYTVRERFLSVIGGYIPFALVGFVLGAVYQYGLLQLMINVIFADVEGVPEYKFDVPVFFITLAAFIASYALIMLFYAIRLGKVSVKEVMAE